MRRDFPIAVALIAFAAVIAGCQSKGGGSGASSGFPEKGLAVYKSNLKQGDNALDHALAETYLTAKDAVTKITGKAQVAEEAHR